LYSMYGIYTQSIYCNFYLFNFIDNKIFITNDCKNNSTIHISNIIHEQIYLKKGIYIFDLYLISYIIKYRKLSLCLTYKNNIMHV